MTQDITPDGLVLGGTGSYSALTASRLGVQVGLVTRAAPELDLEALLPGVAVHKVPGACTTTFENVYDGNERTQWIRKVAAPLSMEDVPGAWRGAPIVHLAPIAREVPLTMGAAFPEALVGATPQGWLRSWDDDGRVRYRPVSDPVETLRDVDVLVFSPEDVAFDRDAMQRLTTAVPVAVVTRAERGCTVYVSDEGRPVAPRPVDVIVDPTGAGDVFAAAFLVRYRETGDPLDAARFANVTASFSIENIGTSGIPTRAQVETWLREYEGEIDRRST